MKTRHILITLTVGILLGLLPLSFAAADAPDGPSKKTPEPKEEIIKMTKKSTEASDNEEKGVAGHSDQQKVAQKQLAKEVSPTSNAQADNGKVYFKRGSDVLDTTAKSILNKTAEWLISHPEAELIIEGHGNEYNSREKNLMMGELRAGNVLSYLVKQGIDETRLTAVSYGSERSRSKKASNQYRVKTWQVCFLVIKGSAETVDVAPVVQEESEPAPPAQKDNEEKEPEKEAEKVEPEKKEAEQSKPEQKKAKNISVKESKPKEAAEENLAQEVTKVAETKMPEQGVGVQGDNAIAEAKVFFEMYVSLVNSFDSKVLDFYSKYAVIYLGSGTSAGQDQGTALIMEKAKPLLQEAFSKAKAQNATKEFSDVTYSMEGKKVRIRSKRNSKPHSMIIGKDTSNEWKIEEETVETLE